MSTAQSSIREQSDPVEVSWLGTVEYEATWDKQREIATLRADGETGDTLLLLEHPATFTAGKRTQPEDLPADPTTPVIHVDRGGRITWHGPGQLVGYPIIKLADPIDVMDYVHRLEAGIMQTLSELGIDTTRVEGRSGVWCLAEGSLPDRKIAALGIRVQRGVTMHGFSLNCDNSFAGFGSVVPCGIADAGVTSISEELGRDVTVADVRERARENVLAALDGRIDLRPDAVAAPAASAAQATPEAPAAPQIVIPS
ncbi:lipoyl(octanoyl) transferase LipB [Dietzia sp.]|uniref:lipoyl(octanoyl) transferase LipB n=1 Tax=Dietzia sp. TaxID=1871616 RepID=UPI002FDB1B8D